MTTNGIPATIVSLKTGKTLGQISLVGKPIPGDELLSTSGSLLRFQLLADRGKIWKAWLDQQNVLMLTEYGQHIVRIVTFPAEGDNQGHLDCIRKMDEGSGESVHPKPKSRSLKKFFS